MSLLKQFQSNQARPLPIIVMADISGSMSEDGKIQALNKALQNMIESFKHESRLRAELQVSVVTFGLNTEVHLPLTPAYQIEGFDDLPASGGTPLGRACQLVIELIENKDIIPSRAYKPVIILVSDGHPTDAYEADFDKLVNHERASKATRFAMGIGADADLELLGNFTNDLEAPVFKAENARDIHRFFRAVTISVTMQQRSTDPNQRTALAIKSVEEATPNAKSEEDEFEDIGF